MIGQITTSLGELNLNIAEMTNVSRGDIAYNIIDIENTVQEEAINTLSSIENVINVRLLKSDSRQIKTFLIISIFILISLEVGTKHLI